MSGDWENTSGPPRQPFYALKERPKKKGEVFGLRPKGWHEKKRAEYAAEVAKPIEQRVGGLKVKADFTEEQIKAFEKMYSPKDTRAPRALKERKGK